MTRHDLSHIPGLGELLESCEKRPAPAGELLPPRRNSSSRFAEPGEIWRVVEPPGQTEDFGYAPLDPHCSAVVILHEVEDVSLEFAAYRVAPVLAEIRYCGLEDAIFPREVFGYEAAVACGCAFTLTSNELTVCEGALPPAWFIQLGQFAAWMHAGSAAAGAAFPARLKTGRPFTHVEDPGYIFHGNLIVNLQPLMATVMEEVWGEEPAEAAGSAFAGVLARIAESIQQIFVPATSSDDSVRGRTLENETVKVVVSSDEAGRQWLHVSSTLPEFAGGRFRIETEPAQPVLAFREAAPGLFVAKVEISPEIAAAISAGDKVKLTPAPPNT